MLVLQSCRTRRQLPRARKSALQGLEFNGVAYRIRTHDPRITKVIVSRRVCRNYHMVGTVLAGQIEFNK